MAYKRVTHTLKLGNPVCSLKYVTTWKKKKERKILSHGPGAHRVTNGMEAEVCGKWLSAT